MPTLCPCLVSKYPCSDRCTCVNPLSSYGCKCCATYGSKKQREDKATKLVETLSIIDDNDSELLYTNNF